MKTYRELYFQGKPKQLAEFVEYFRKYEGKNWKAEGVLDGWEDCLCIRYSGEMADKARVSIIIDDKIETGKLKVDHIVPLEKYELSIDEYNAVLMQFYHDLILPYRERNAELNISGPSDDIFDPTTVISERALEKLKLFCFQANKPTGSTRPCDEERWFDFICQTFDDGRMFHSTVLESFLQDETYWEEKAKDFNCETGEYVWDEDQACELATEYEYACEILSYYKKTRGL